MAEWRQLLKLGVKYRKNGRPNADLSECLCTCMTATSKPLPESPQCWGAHLKREAGKSRQCWNSSSGPRGLNTTIATETGKQLLHQQDGNLYIKPLQHTIAGFGNFGPAMEKKLACHPDLLAFECK